MTPPGSGQARHRKGKEARRLHLALRPENWQLMYDQACFDLQITREAAGVSLRTLCEKNHLHYETMQKLERREIGLCGKAEGR